VPCALTEHSNATVAIEPKGMRRSLFGILTD
jgi:hypothetical protein